MTKQSRENIFCELTKERAMIVLRPGIVTGREIDRSDGEAGAWFDGRVQTSNADQAGVSPSHQKNKVTK